MTATYKEITQKILDLLEANVDFKADVKEYYFGQRAIDDPRVKYPHVFADMDRDDVKPFVGKEKHEMFYFVGVTQKHADKDVALKFVQDKAEKIQNILNANPTLDGLVEESYFVPSVIIDWVPTRGYTVVGARLTLYARKVVRL